MKPTYKKLIIIVLSIFAVWLALFSKTSWRVRDAITQKMGASGIVLQQLNSLSYNGNFYGKVVDFEGNPLPNITVELKISKSFKEWDIEKFQLVTDKDGLFSKKGIWGRSSFVQALPTDEYAALNYQQAERHGRGSYEAFGLFHNHSHAEHENPHKPSLSYS